MAPNVLVIGGTGRLGIQIVHAAANHHSTPAIHVFARTPSRLPSEVADKCASLQQGDALNESDIANALSATRANVVIMAIGIPDDLKKSTIREESARVLMQLVKPGAQFDHVRVICVSSVGAGGTKIDLGFGMGSALAWILRHIMQDHTNQERVFLSEFGEQGKKRLLIVRPCSLIDGKPTGKVMTFDAMKKTPVLKVDRADVAQYVVEQTVNDYCNFGTAVNITTSKN